LWKKSFRTTGVQRNETYCKTVIREIQTSSQLMSRTDEREWEKNCYKVNEKQGEGNRPLFQPRTRK